MHKPATFLENKTNKILSSFEIKYDSKLSTKTPDVVLVNKTCRLVEWGSEQVTEWK